MTGVDAARVLAGAPVLWPATTVPGGVELHLARAEARRKSGPVLVGVCPQWRDKELIAALWPSWWRRLARRRRWCPDCAAYRDYLRGRGEL